MVGAQFYFGDGDDDSAFMQEYNVDFILRSQEGYLLMNSR